MTVEMIYDKDCPNVTRARKHLLRAFAETGIPARWLEWDRGDFSRPSHVRAYGSPTILVDEKDVAGIDPSDGVSCCRLYSGSNGEFSGAPSVNLIAAALKKSRNGRSASMSNRAGSAQWRSFLATFPGIGASFLPAGICPACWPAYAGLLSSLGLGFLLETAYLLPLTVVFLFIAMVALAYRAKARRGYGPFALGLAASALVLVGKFVFESDLSMYGGTAMLVIASFWNAWPRKNVGADNDACPACASVRQTSQLTQPEATTTKRRKEVLP